MQGLGGLASCTLQVFQNFSNVPVQFKKNVTLQTWQALFHFGEYFFQSTRHFGDCLKNMVSHTE
jgi:hypothetical protein